ncbi:MAG: lipase family alpha/beta hydrolase, partial [Thermodesulfobacteriota bacterium]
VIDRTLLLKHYKGAKNEIKVDIVGHSMGGLIITEYLSQQKSNSKVGKVVSLGTPFLGSIEAIVKITTGMGLISGSIPKEREREAARATPSIYQLFPSYEKCVIDQDGKQVDLFKPVNLQRSIVNSLSEYVRLYSVDTLADDRDKKANEILLGLLIGGIEHREKVNSFKLSDAKLKQDDWLAIVGVNSETRIQISVKNSTRGPWFIIDEDQFVNELRVDSKSRKTGDGTVPLLGAIPPFIPENKLVCVTPDDLGRFELRDQLFLKLAGLHGILPTINLVQRLTVKHLKSDYRGEIWGRRVPGADKWNPPIPDLTVEREY